MTPKGLFIEHERERENYLWWLALININQQYLIQGSYALRAGYFLVVLSKKETTWKLEDKMGRTWIHKSYMYDLKTSCFLLYDGISLYHGPQLKYFGKSEW